RAETADGPRLAFPAEALPVYGLPPQHMTGEAFARADGFGGASPILFTWPGATLLGAPPVFEPAASLAPDSQTVLLDADTGERLAHWAEFDHLTLGRGEPLIVLRAAAPLPRGHRVIVAVRGLVDADGVILPPTPGFLALRDGEPTDLAGVDDRRARFEAEVFAPLAAAGVDRADLQLAWDFTVATGPNGHDTLRVMRDRLMAAIGDDGPAYTLTAVEPVGDRHITWMATGVARVPSFLGPPDEFGLRRHHLDADGLPRIEGFEDVEFTLQFPPSVLEGGQPGGVLQYGHGFLGSKGQGEGGWLRSMADEYGFLILSADMQGMSTMDFTVWLQILARRPSEFPYLYEKAMQGVMNHLALQRMMRGRFLREVDERLTGADGQPVYDPDDLMYYGNSQGGTMGAVIMALTQDVRRGVLGVPGGAFPFLLQRSVVFEDFVRILDNTFRDRIEFSLVLGLLGTGWDPMDPMTVAPHITTDPLPGTPPHEVLLHVAKEDAQVHNQVSFMLGRAIGVGAATPLVEPAWGLPPTDLPFTGSLLAEFDFNHPDNPDPLRPPVKANDTHSDLRNLPAGQRQMMHFLRTGEVIDVCDGQPCRFDPP
ncbi:MAG: hypothetical protein KC549_01000, partial [Myxococcales bacterium]|nr:hypothetical protein [Myxococcales bacterium]